MFIQNNLFSRSDRLTEENAVRKDFHAAMGAVDSKLNFKGCNEFAMNFCSKDAPTSESNKVRKFIAERSRLLDCVWNNAIDKFGEDEDCAQKYLEWSKENVRVIDPALIGEDRYEENDSTIVKILKCCYYILNRVFTRSRLIDMWVTRCEIMNWGMNQDLETYRDPSPLSIRNGVYETPAEIRTRLVQSICIKEMGFPEAHQESLEALVHHLPDFRSFTYDADEKTFSLEMNEAKKGIIGWPALTDALGAEGLVGLIADNQELKDLGAKTFQSHFKVAPVASGRVTVNEIGETELVFDKEAIRLIIPTEKAEIYIDLNGIAHLGGGVTVPSISLSASSMMLNLKMKAAQVFYFDDLDPVSLPSSDKLVKTKQCLHWV